MKKRLVAFLLVLIMVLGMLPVSAMAAGSVVTARGSAENPIRIYENSGNQAETSNGSVQVPVGETVTDSGVLTFSTYSAIEGVQVSKGGVYCAVTSSNENVVKATGSWSGGVLTINFLGVGNGTAKITVDYTCTCSKNAVANGLLIYNVTVGDGGSTDPSGKPNAPTASDIGAFPDAGKAVLLHCVDAGARGHDATASSLNKVQNGYSVGEVVENPGTYYNVDGGKITKEQFPWMCVVTVHAAPFIELYNSNFSERYGVHKLAGTSNATAILHWFWHNTYGWQYLENPPIQFNITRDTSEKTYTLNYYKNTTDTVTNMPEPNPQTEKSNTGMVTFTVSNARPSRDGYTFLGWAGNPDATTATVKPGNTITTPRETTNLYAVWQSNTPPTDKPAKPTENDVIGVVVDIVCVTTTGTHDTVQYPLGHPTDAQHTIGEVVSDGAGGYICPVTVRTAWFVQQASNLRWKVQHTPTAQTITFNLTYDKTNKKWVKPAANPRIEATHEVTPPTKPTLNEGSPVCVQCEKTNSIHVQNGKDYARMYFGVSDSTRYTEVLKDGKNVWKDDNGVWTYQIKLKKDKYIEAFNTTPLINSEHTDLYPDQDAYVTWKRDGNQWKIVPVSPNQSGIGAVINVTCKLKAPTADELKKLDMAVQVKCVVDAAQQHTSAYGLLGEYDKDYFVGEPKKVGDDWLCDISYDPDPYVAAFNKAFPTPKHIQNDEKIVPVTLIWVGGSWQIKTQGRVLVTEVYTVTFDSYGGTPVPPAQEVEYGHTATKPADPTLKGYTFAFWYLGEDEQNATAYDFNTPVTENITLTAKWNINKYTVAFNTDGGTPVPPAQEVEYGLTAPEPAAPEKTGYTFDGWYLGDEKYDFSAAVEQNITLTAKWQKKTFTVKYYLPDETGAWVEKKMDTVDSVDYATYSLWTPNAEDGYEFSGWYQKPADIGVKAKVEKLYMAKEWKLYGKFTPIEYTIQYVYNDGKATSTNPTTYTVESDTITLADATGADWGKTFLEWHDENGQKITEIPTGSTGDRVITAYWNWPVHLHYLDKDNNEIESATLYVSELEPGACVLPTGEKTGYDFDGWYEAKKDIGTASHKLNALSIAKKWELYGRYTAKTDVSYTVKYLREGDNKVLAPEKVVTDQTFDTEVTEQAADVVGYTPDAPSKTMILDEYNKVLTFSYSANTYDYTVRHIKQLPDGSYDEANAEVETLSGKFEALAAVTAKDYGEHYPTNDADTKQNIKIEEGLTIDVKYDLDEHTLTFETNGGSAINPVTVRHGNAVARPADPTKDKYTFIGWYADPEFTEEYDFATVLEADKTIYAKFELTSTPIGDIYVRYDVLHIKQLPDGTYDLANAEVEHLSAKKDTTVTAVIKDYRATHHVNVNRTLSKLTGTAIQPYKGVDGKPVYTILSVYYDLDFHTLTFDTMGGSKIAPETVRHGLTVAKPKDPVNGGYWFDGWYTDKTYRTPYNFATPLTQDTTIYAKWFLIVLPGVTVKKNTPKLNTADHFAYVQGYPDGTVKPAGNITRAETAAILFRLMDDASRKTYYSTKSGFRDVASGSWYNTYVATLNNAGVITDSSNGCFRPNEAITRAELAAMLAKFSETTGAANYFNDVSAKYWAANAIAICAKLGWITGYPDGTFRPDKNVTRAELMAMINRATGRAPKSADAFLPGMKTWIDNTSDKWYYLDVQEATNSHSYTVKGSETWTALTSDPNWSLYE